MKRIKVWVASDEIHIFLQFSVLFSVLLSEARILFLKSGKQRCSENCACILSYCSACA
jgi:hypothetical protein